MNSLQPNINKRSTSFQSSYQGIPTNTEKQECKLWTKQTSNQGLKTKLSPLSTQQQQHLKEIVSDPQQQQLQNMIQKALMATNHCSEDHTILSSLREMTAVATPTTTPSPKKVNNNNTDDLRPSSSSSSSPTCSRQLLFHQAHTVGTNNCNSNNTYNHQPFGQGRIGEGRNPIITTNNDKQGKSESLLLIEQALFEEQERQQRLRMMSALSNVVQQQGQSQTLLPQDCSPTQLHSYNNHHSLLQSQQPQPIPSLLLSTAPPSSSGVTTNSPPHHNKKRNNNTARTAHHQIMMTLLEKKIANTIQNPSCNMISTTNSKSNNNTTNKNIHYHSLSFIHE